MLQAEQDGLARVLDALLLVGFKPGDWLTAAQAYAALGEMGIGRNAIYAALKATSPDGRSVFERSDVDELRDGTIEPDQSAPPAPPLRLRLLAYAALRRPKTASLVGSQSR
ncbi:hypothetical protein HC928_10545 [bacterium]|nr:hypothetical protein [bacterium]